MTKFVFWKDHHGCNMEKGMKYIQQVGDRETSKKAVSKIEKRDSGDEGRKVDQLKIYLEVESIQMSWEKMVVSGKGGIESGTQISVLGKRIVGSVTKMDDMRNADKAHVEWLSGAKVCA